MESPEPESPESVPDPDSESPLPLVGEVVAVVESSIAPLDSDPEVGVVDAVVVPSPPPSSSVGQAVRTTLAKSIGAQCVRCISGNATGALRPVTARPRKLRPGADLNEWGSSVGAEQSTAVATLNRDACIRPRAHRGSRDVRRLLWCSVDVGTAEPADDATATLDATTASTPAWEVSILAHPDRTRVGSTVTVRAPTPLELGRACTSFGDGALDLAHISRRHATLTVDDEGRMHIADAGSRNGTFFEGERIRDSITVGPGLLAIGRTVLYVTPSTDGPTWTRAAGTAEALLARGRPVLLVGESGNGKRWLAHELVGEHATSVDLRRDGESALDAIEGAAIVSGLQVLDAGGATRTHRWLETRAEQDTPLALTWRTPPALFAQPGEGFSRLRSTLAPFAVELPPLREEPVRIAILACRFAARYAPQLPLEPELVIRLVGHGWPGNVRELEAVVERAAVEAGDDGPLTIFADLDAILASPPDPELISTHGETVTREPFLVASDGTWFRRPGGKTCDLQSRRVLARVLAKLLQAHREDPRTRVGVPALLKAGWPDERLLPKAGANRVYVALTTLRKMGLRELVARGDGGYGINVDVPLTISDP